MIEIENENGDYDENYTSMFDVKLNISDKPKTLEEYVVEANLYYRRDFSYNDDIDLEEIYSLDEYKVNSKLRKSIIDFFKYEDEQSEKETIEYRNVDSIVYSEAYVNNILFYVRNSNSEDEKHLYYKRLLFLEDWKWNVIETLILNTNELKDFCKSPEYRKWKISKLLGD